MSSFNSVAATLVPFYDGAWVDRETFGYGVNRIVGHTCTTVLLVSTLVALVAKTAFAEQIKNESIVILSLMGVLSTTLIVLGECIASEASLNRTCIDHVIKKSRPDVRAVSHILGRDTHHLISMIPFEKRQETLRKLTRSGLSFLELVRTGDGKTLKILMMHGSDPHYRIERGHSAFQRALESRDFPRLEAYAAQKPPLDCEVVRLFRHYTDAEMLNFLIRKCSFNPNALDRNGISTMEHWISDPQVPLEAFEVLIGLGANTNAVMERLEKQLNMRDSLHERYEELYAAIPKMKRVRRSSC